MRYGEVYEEGRQALASADIAEAKLDARLLLEDVCGTNRNTLLAHPEYEVPEEQYRRYQDVIHRRKKHVPLQYITGVQDFMGLNFKVSEKVLIPRQDTEVLVEEVMKHLHDGMSVLDMCTGSGCILLSLLHYSNDCAGTGADISNEALKIAQENAEALQLKPVLLQSNLFGQIEGSFDVIVSNPPYIESAVMETLMPEVRDNEPWIALDGGADGLYFYNKIIEESKKFLNGGGHLFFEIGCNQAEAVSKKMILEGYQNVTVKKDFSGLDRVVYGRKQ